MKSIPLSISEEMQLMEQELKRHFSPSQLEELAKKTGFIHRKSKFTASDFVSLRVFLTDDLSTRSLTRLCSQLDAQRNLSMSTEGLNQRFNTAGITFLRKPFSALLREKIASNSSIPCSLDAHFHRIRVLDATVFQLPDEYVSSYSGSGGSAHTAGIKIQLEYELKSSQFLQIDVGHGKNSDGLYGSERAKTVEKDDLCIRDLGYF